MLWHLDNVFFYYAETHFVHLPRGVGGGGSGAQTKGNRKKRHVGCGSERQNSPSNSYNSPPLQARNQASGMFNPTFSCVALVSTWPAECLPSLASLQVNFWWISPQVSMKLYYPPSFIFFIFDLFFLNHSGKTTSFPVLNTPFPANLQGLTAWGVGEKKQFHLTLMHIDKKGK